mgnify:CR=1 FL=1
MQGKKFTMNESTVQPSLGKWKVVYSTTITGTVSQEKVDSLKKWLKENPRAHVGNTIIELNYHSPDEDYAKYLMLQGEALEQPLDRKIEDCEKIE